MTLDAREDCLLGGGLMGELMRAWDWGATSLGRVRSWPQSLRTSVSICLGTSFPAMIAWGPELSMLYNDGYVPMLGRRKHPRALGQPLLECFGERRDRLGRVFREVLETGHPYGRRDVVLPVDREGDLEEASFDVCCTPIREESGRIGGILTTCVERVRAAPLSLLMQFSTPICVLRGPQYVVELANPVCCEVWGRQPQEVIGRSLLEVLPELEHQPYRECLDGVLRTGEQLIGKQVPVELGPEGQRLTSYFNFVYSPLRDPGGAVDGVLVVAFDVTDEVRAREALSQTVRYNELFAGILAHDLRSPLGAISTAAQLVKMRRPDDERIGPPVSRILSSSTRMARMIEQLLDFTRIRLGGGLRLERNSVDLVEVLRSVISETESASPGWRA
ncbi:MAG TPA: PAS domain-containing protein, partial [Dehalococcoidia bacterium]|nr:PAS domain-containing protein [Dehalococcoidia bacterium]